MISATAYSGIYRYWYSLNNGFTNTTCETSGDLSTQWSSYGTDSIRVTFWANSTTGLVNTNNVIIYKDIIAPTINLVSPINGSTNPSGSMITVNITDNVQLNATWYNWDNGLNASTIGSIILPIGNGVHTLTVFANNVEQSNGLIQLKTNPGIGTKMSIQLPVITTA